MCINDGFNIENERDIQEKLNNSLEELFDKKSEFER